MTEKSTKLVLTAALAATLALPFIFRPAAVEEEPGNHLSRDLPVKELILISPHWEGVRSEFSRAFSAWTVERFGHRTELEWLDMGGTSDSVRYVRSEFTRAPEGINVDIFFGGGVDPFMQFAAAGLLQAVQLPPHVLEAIPETFAGIQVYDPGGTWFGAALAGFGILHNKVVCQRLDLPIPRSWEDMADPRYRSWVGSGDPRSSGSVHMAYEIILQAYGWERGWSIITRMCGNTRIFSRAASEVPKDAAAGEIACGMCIDVYAWRQVAEVGADRMGFVLPQGVTVINPDGIAVLKGAPHPRLATAFIEFVLSEAGQKLWCLKRGVPGGPTRFALNRLPVIPGLARRFGDEASVVFDPYTWESGFTYDAAKGGRRWTLLNDLIGATMIDTHGELIAAWKHVSRLPPDDPRRMRLTTPPLTEAEALTLAETCWSDPECRAQTTARWAVEARQRYRNLVGDSSW